MQQVINVITGIELGFVCLDHHANRQLCDPPAPSQATTEWLTAFAYSGLDILHLVFPRVCFCTDVTRFTTELLSCVLHPSSWFLSEICFFRLSCFTFINPSSVCLHIGLCCPLLCWHILIGHDASRYFHDIWVSRDLKFRDFVRQVVSR